MAQDAVFCALRGISARAMVAMLVPEDMPRAENVMVRNSPAPPSMLFRRSSSSETYSPPPTPSKSGLRRPTLISARAHEHGLEGGPRDGQPKAPPLLARATDAPAGLKGIRGGSNGACQRLEDALQDFETDERPMNVNSSVEAAPMEYTVLDANGELRTKYRL
uniref:Uncharacterized protein n=1 Tax=Alexandrium monilatum TaxID=311494 RepID=A0A7S4PVG3_9DINO